MKKPKEIHKVIYQNENIMAETIYSRGWSSPQNEWFDQNEDETVFIAAGSAVIELEKGKVELNKGDSLLLKAHTKHRVDFTTPDCVWLCVFTKN